jgi:PST family polysaccharide transporter
MADLVQTSETKESVLTNQKHESGFFDTEYLKSDLKGRSVRGGTITMTAQVIKFVLQIGSTVVLARLLTPQDYGLVAMVTVISGFVALFKDMGLSMATIQKAEINHSQVSTLFWINVAVSLVLALVLAVTAPIISWFYGEPRLTRITLALAGTFIFSGLTVQHQALLQRQMRFSALAAIEIGSLIISIVVGIALAWYGAGYWALVGSSVALSVSYAVLVWVFCGWRPGLPLRRAGVRPMLAFGGHLTGFGIVNYFARSLDHILLGRFWGANVLGLYSKAYNLFMLPIAQIRGPLTVVALPALSGLKNDPNRYTKYYCKFAFILAFITMPLMGFLFLCSENIIRLVLGSKWLGANAIFKILAIAGFIQSVETVAGIVLLSMGLSKRYLIWGALRSVFFVVSFFLGIPWGAAGVAASYTIAQYLIMIPSLWYAFRQTSISVVVFLKTLTGPAISSLATTFIMFLFYKFMLVGQSDIVSIGLCLSLGTAIYLVIWVLTPGGIHIIRELCSYVFLLMDKKYAQSM